MNNNFNDGFTDRNNLDSSANNLNKTHHSTDEYINPYSNNINKDYTNTSQTTNYYSSSQSTPTQSNANSYSNTDYYSSSNSNPYINTQQTSTQYGDNYSTTPQVIQPTKKKKNSTGKTFAKTIAIALCFGLVAGGTMFGVNYAGNQLANTGSISSSSSTSKENNSIKATTPVTNNENGGNSTTYDVATVVNNVMPAMVSINIKATATYENPYSQYFGFDFGFGGGEPYQYETEGSGSGIIISENENELLIVTNNHVIDGATEISVCFVDESTSSATIKGTDPDYDLAVISVKLSDIPQDTKDTIAVATLGDSEKIQLGQPAIAIGNALGYGQSVTVGYISALEREVQLTDNTMSLIQTDAAINPGNSGGALLDMSGSVIGINSAKYSDTDVEGMGYAIPISDASPIIDGLINHKTISESEQAYLGIVGTDVTDSYSQAFGLPTGIYISKVNVNSPADVAGIQAGDIITEFDGKSLSTMESLQSRIKSHKAGDRVEITLQRQQRNGDYQEVTLTVTLGSKADAPKA